MPHLVDQFGRPLANPGRMRKEDEDLILGLRRKRFAGIIAGGLTPAKLVGIYAEVDRGRYDNFLTLAKDLERHDSHYRSVLGVRKLAVITRPPIVQSTETDDLNKEVAIAAQELVSSDQWMQMSLWALDALGKGYSVTEMIWDFSEGQAWPRFKRRDPRDFGPDLETLTKIRRKVPGTSLLEELQWGKYLLHMPSLIAGGPVDGALAITDAILYLFGQLALHDMGDFIERYGTPTLIGEYTNDDQKQGLLDGLAALARAGYGVVSKGSAIKVLDGARSSGSETLHQDAIALMNGEKSKLVLGQTMTSEDGSSRSQAEVHERVEERVNAFDVTQLCQAQLAQILNVWVFLNFGENAAPLTLDRPGDDEEDIGRVAEVLFGMADRGAQVPVRHLNNLLGIGEIDEAEDMLEPISTGKGDIAGRDGRFDAPLPVEEGEGAPVDDGGGEPVPDPDDED